MISLALKRDILFVFIISQAVINLGPDLDNPTLTASGTKCGDGAVRASNFFWTRLKWRFRICFLSLLFYFKYVYSWYIMVYKYVVSQIKREKN